MTYTTKYISVVAVFEQDGKYLFTYRAHTGAFDGYYLLPGGHLETGERIQDALIREIKEELDVYVDRNDMTFKLVKSEKSHIAYFFQIKRYNGSITNKEPDKHDHLAWLSPNDERIPDFVKEELRLIQSGVHFAEDD